MSQGESIIRKPTLSEELLKKCDIFFFAHVHAGRDLPEQIRPMQEHLLRFRGEIAWEEREEVFAEERRTFRMSGLDSKEAFEKRWSLMPSNAKTDSIYIQGKKEEQTAEMKTELKICKRVQEEAIRLRKRCEPEAEWVKLLRADIFQSFHKVYPKAKNYCETHSRWELHQDLHWNEFRRWKSTNPNITRLTGPKPDLTYAFPIIDTSKPPTSDCMAQFDPYVQGFSLQVLKDLRNNSKLLLKSAPTTPFKDYNETKHPTLGAQHLICYPWAIVEAKKCKSNKSDEIFCYCQAANASASALQLRERLARKSKDPSRAHDTLSIFAFTCVGPSVKLWVTYRDAKSRGIEMRCIWATSLELTWGVLVLRMVVKNMLEWVYNRIKPEIARRVCLVRQNLLSRTVRSPDGDVIKQKRRAVSCVPPSKNLAITPPTTPDRVVHSSARLTPLRGKTAPGSVGRKSHRYDSPSNTLCKGRHEMREFIDDAEAGDDWYEQRERADEGYNSEGEEDNECRSESESSEDDDDYDDNEVKDLLKLQRAWYPEYNSKNGKQHHHRVAGISRPETSDEDEDEDEEEEEKEDYLIDEQRIVIRKAKKKMTLAVDSLRNKDRSKDRRRSSRF